MSETSPYDDEELSEHGLRVRLEGLRTRIAELEALVAQLGAALDRIRWMCGSSNTTTREQDCLMIATEALAATEPKS